MSDSPRLCVVGAVVGRHAGRITTQGEVVADALAGEGYRVLAVSSAPNRYGRLIDIVVTLLRQRRSLDVQLLQVYAGLSFVLEDVASWLGRLCGQRIVMHVHGGAIPHFMARFPLWTRRVFRRAHVIVTPSTYLQRALAARGFSARVIPNVVHVDSYPYRLRDTVRPRLFWMRTFHQAYNPELAVRAFARVRAQRSDATLTLAGADKGSAHAVKALARDLRLGSSVRFPGFLDHAAKVREGDAHDIFLNTNRIDNMPVSVAEALVMGLPVVATAVGGVPDMLRDGETGLLVPDDDPDAMAAAILRLVSEPDLARGLSHRGREMAEQWRWEHLRKLWDAVLHGCGSTV